MSSSRFEKGTGGAAAQQDTGFASLCCRTEGLNPLPARLTSVRSGKETVALIVAFLHKLVDLSFITVTNTIPQTVK